MPQKPTERLQVRVEAFHGPETDLLNLVPVHSDFHCWLGPGTQVIGWGEALRLEFVGIDAIRESAQAWDKVVGDTQINYVGGPAEAFPGAYPLAFASFGFASSTPGMLIVPKVAVVRRDGRTFTVTAASGSTPPTASSVLGSVSRCEPVASPADLLTNPGRMTQSQWVAAVRRLIALLRAGAASKVVLARDIVVSSSVRIDERFLVAQLRQLYPTTWVYAVGGLVGATPEMLAAKTGDDVVSRILAGTSGPGKGEQLLDSDKDLSEHHFAVESVARALAPIAQRLDVPPAPSLLDLPNVTHLSTEIRARVPGISLLDIVAALHPTAAVCGTPRKLAFEILEEIEGTQRGRYSGPVGWIDGAGAGEFGIALRCGQLSEDHHQIRIFAGGGIMPDSVPAAELAETRAKMKPLLQALGLEDSGIRG